MTALDFGFRATRISRRLRQLVDSELAAALGLEGPSLVRLLDNLERRGLIERREHKSDRRVRGIYLTPSGRELQRRVTSISDGGQQRLLAASPADPRRLWATVQPH
ncbi:MarR family transcriptional regulator [Reyranella sp.]|nr:MarR family transcriptional regulator [Reyranella sp.]